MHWLAGNAYDNYKASKDRHSKSAYWKQFTTHQKRAREQVSEMKRLAKVNPQLKHKDHYKWLVQKKDKRTLTHILSRHFVDLINIKQELNDCLREKSNASSKPVALTDTQFIVSSDSVIDHSNTMKKHSKHNAILPHKSHKLHRQPSSSGSNSAALSRTSSLAANASLSRAANANTALSRTSSLHRQNSANAHISRDWIQPSSLSRTSSLAANAALTGAANANIALSRTSSLQRQNSVGRRSSSSLGRTISYIPPALDQVLSQFM
jgi:hypothetical protein